MNCNVPGYITEEMVTAGSDAISSYWTQITDPKSDLSIVPQLVADIYEAMEAERIKRNANPKP